MGEAVLLEVAGATKRLAARGTGVAPLHRVDQQVALQAARPDEGFLAITMTMIY